MNQDQERGLRPEDRTKEASREQIHTPAEHQRHYAPLNRELHPEDTQHFGWRAENGSVQTYQHSGTQRHVHIDGPSGQFFDQQRNPISQHAALDRATGPGNHHASEPVRAQEQMNQQNVDQGIGLGL